LKKSPAFAGLFFVGKNLKPIALRSRASRRFLSPPIATGCADRSYGVCRVLQEPRPAAMFSTQCNSETIAPHIHVLSRGIPFILNIIATGYADRSYRFNQTM
jgi:hypothetical protein